MVSDTLLLIILAIISIAYLWSQYKLRKFNIYKFPGPPKLPFFGNVFSMPNSESTLTNYKKWTNKYGDIVNVQIGPFRQFLVVLDLELIKLILTSNKILDRPDDYLFFESLVGQGLLLAKGQKWRSRRKFMTPALHFNILELFVDYFHKPVNILVSKLKKCVNLGYVNIYPLINLCALDVICVTTMGVELNVQNQEHCDYEQALKKLMQIYTRRAFSVINRYDFFYQFTEAYREEIKCAKIVQKFSRSIVAKRKAELESEDVQIKIRSYLDLMLEAHDENGHHLTTEELREDVDVMIIAGHDTTTAGVSFALYLLSQHPEIQEKVFNEVESIVGTDKNTTITYADLNKMNYMEQVIKETIRLFPSVPVIGRKLKEELRFGDVILGKELDIAIPFYVLHRLEKHFPNPDKFDPSRFDPGREPPKPYSYLPFSTGPRNCVGYKFAYLELKYTIAQVLRNFELFPCSPPTTLRLRSEVILKAAEGTPVRLVERVPKNGNKYVA